MPSVIHTLADMTSNNSSSFIMLISNDCGYVTPCITRSSAQKIENFSMIRDKDAKFTEFICSSVDPYVNFSNKKCLCSSVSLKYFDATYV
jgi:hypothetical protein